MADILAFPTPAPKDGGARERNRARIAHISGQELRVNGHTIGHVTKISVGFGDLAMGSADPEDTAPAEYVARTRLKAAGFNPHSRQS
jgi:hypothetical protein